MGSLLSCQCCFIYAWDHCFNHCKEPCDQSCIAQNGSKFQEERNRQSSDGCSNWRCSHGSHNHLGIGNKLGVTKTASVANGGVHWFNGIWMAFCGKYKTWSGALYSYTTGFHDAVFLTNTNYCLPNTHPLYYHHSSTNKRIGTSAPVVNTAASIPGG